MTAKLLNFDIENFQNKIRETRRKYKKQKLLEKIIFLITVMGTISIIVFVAYFSSIKKNATTAIGILLVGVSLMILIVKILLNNISLPPKQEYELHFINLILDKKEIISAEIILNSLLIRHELKFAYRDNGQIIENCSHIEIDIKPQINDDNLWYDLSCNTLYVPSQTLDRVKCQNKIWVDTHLQALNKTV
ncbi:MAG: hypothetical protein U0O22_06090 [Acutalibacteraceae bacterium]